MQRGPTRSTRKRPVNLKLSADLVTEAKSVTDNHSGVVESLRGEFLSKERERRAGILESARTSVTLWNDFADRNGSIADEYSTLQ